MMFSESATSTQETVDMKIHMTNLEKFLAEEVRTWWDLSTLQKYIDKEMVPRGLRVRKFPTTVLG